MMAFANDAQKERFLKPLARGELLGAFCLTEPHVGSEAGGLRTTAVQRRRRLRAQRRQAVHHQRQERRPRDRDGGHRQGRRQEGHQRLPGADQHARLRRRAHRGEDGPARERHRADPVRGLPHPRGQPDRRGGPGPEDRAVRARGRTHRHRVAVGGHGARGVRGGAGVFEGSRRVRQADLRAPGDPVQAGRHGHADRGRAPADPPRREPEGRRPAVPEGGRDGQAVRQRDGRARVLRGDPGVRRLRLH